jgi:hypothetical protein
MLELRLTPAYIYFHRIRFIAFAILAITAKGQRFFLDLKSI